MSAGSCTPPTAANTWNPTIDIDADVHQVAITQELVLAACAGGLATSADRGSTWTMRSDGLDAPYSRAVAVCGDSVLVSASTGPGADGPRSIEAASAAVRSNGARTGLPAWFADNIDTYCLDALNDGSFAAFGTGDGHLFGSADVGSTWSELASGLPPIQHLLVVPD